MLAETSSPYADPHPNTKIVGDSAYLLQLLLSNKYRYTEQNYCYLALLGFKKRIAHAMANPRSNKNSRVVRGLLGTAPPNPTPSNPPRPPRLRCRFGIEVGSNRCRIDVESMPNRRPRRGGRGGFEGERSGGPGPNKSLTTSEDLQGTKNYFSAVPRLPV